VQLLQFQTQNGHAGADAAFAPPPRAPPAHAPARSLALSLDQLAHVRIGPGSARAYNAHLQKHLSQLRANGSAAAALPSAAPLHEHPLALRPSSPRMPQPVRAPDGVPGWAAAEFQGARAAASSHADQLGGGGLAPSTAGVESAIAVAKGEDSVSSGQQWVEVR
jgi:hypothetical protein